MSRESTLSVHVDKKSLIRSLFNMRGKPVYVSIDLVPTFKVERVNALALSRLVNVSMLREGHPRSWFKHLNNYANGDMEKIRPKPPYYS